MQRQQTDKKSRIKLENAYDDLVELFKNNRIDIKDISECNNIETLKNMIIQANKKAKGNLFIAIDGLHNSEVNAGNVMQRETNIKRANVLKGLSDVFKIPVITTAELKKPKDDKKEPTVNDLMETSKYAYNANLVLLLWKSDQAQDDSTCVTVRMKYAKNKLSYYKGTNDLTLQRSKSIMTEWKPSDDLNTPPKNENYNLQKDFPKVINKKISLRNEHESIDQALKKLGM